MSGMMEKVKAKVDNVMHKDKSHDDTTAHNTSGTHTGSTGVAGEHHGSGVGTGLGSSGTHGEHYPSHATTGTTGLGSSTGTHGSTGYSESTGPHQSGMMNKADPRVDSDRLGTAGNTAGAGGVGAGQYTESHGTTGTGLAGHSTTGAYPAGNTMGTSSGLTGHGTSDFRDQSGPHNSGMMNKADPRVDSDRLGTAGNTAGAGGVGAGQYTESHGTTGTGLAGSHTANTNAGHFGSTAGVGSTNAGLHGSNAGLHGSGAGLHGSHAANTADPRVGGIGSTDAGLHGSNAGLHSSNAGVTGTGEHLKTAPGEVGGTGHNNLSHRNNEDGGLPKALTEDKSHAEPHSSVRDQHTSGSHHDVDAHGKPSLKDRLNPKIDSDMDGKRGIMD